MVVGQTSHIHRQGTGGLQGSGVGQSGSSGTVADGQCAASLDQATVVEQARHQHAGVIASALSDQASLYANCQTVRCGDVDAARLGQHIAVQGQGCARHGEAAVGHQGALVLHINRRSS